MSNNETNHKTTKLNARQKVKRTGRNSGRVGSANSQSNRRSPPCPALILHWKNALLSNYLCTWAWVAKKSPGSLTGIIQAFPGTCAATAPNPPIVLKQSNGAPKRDEGCRVTTALWAGELDRLRRWKAAQPIVFWADCRTYSPGLSTRSKHAHQRGNHLPLDLYCRTVRRYKLSLFTPRSQTPQAVNQVWPEQTCVPWTHWYWWAAPGCCRQIPVWRLGGGSCLRLQGQGRAGQLQRAQKPFSGAGQNREQDGRRFGRGTCSPFVRDTAGLRKTLTLDNGSEMARFKELERATGMSTYFCRPHSPWQRGANENANGLLRQYFPRRISFHKITEKMVVEAPERLNNRPRKCLGYQTPAEVLNLALRDALASWIHPASGVSVSAPMAIGFMYLVSIMDWASRKILGWCLFNTLNSRFCVDALKEALCRYGAPDNSVLLNFKWVIY